MKLNKSSTLIIIIFSILVAAYGVDMFSKMNKSIRGERTKRIKELTNIGIELKQAVLNKDTKILLEYVGESILAIDTPVSRKEIENSLSNNDSYLYCHLFDSKCIKGESVFENLSVREYLKRAKNLSIKIDFSTNERGKIKLYYGRILYKSSNFDPLQWPESCFIFDGKKWKFSNMPFSCD